MDVAPISYDRSSLERIVCYETNAACQISLLVKNGRTLT
jgi:hypothetical protein